MNQKSKKNVKIHQMWDTALVGGNPNCETLYREEYW